LKYPLSIDLQAAAKQAMREHGFDPEFPAAVQEQLAAIRSNSRLQPANGVRDLRAMLWSSIDNDTSRDLDQVEFASGVDDQRTRVLVGIADVDAFVSQRSPIDDHAAAQTTTVYTGVQIFPMLPEELSTGTTSLLEGADKLATIIEFTVDADGCVSSSDVYRALVRNQAQLAYGEVGAWLEGEAAPPKVAASAELQAQLRLQDATAQRLKTQRHLHGALDLDTREARPVISGAQVTDLIAQEKNRATDLIEDFMIAANGVVARRLESVSSLRRVVKTPERWDRIVQLAAEQGERLPADPDAKALNDFLARRKAADADHFPDLSLAVIKLMGPGEYVLERPGDPGQGHFGLAVQDYTHSTAPNRRFADLVTQRIVKALLRNQPAPYSDSDLDTIARNCTAKEDAARKVEREMSKRIAAIAMSRHIGESFDAIVTGITPRGSFVRVTHPTVDGLLLHGHKDVDVGDRLRVRLASTDVQRGYIDFAQV
jgi:VacB/RNase II family 3'-5' exoribonuclease